MIIRLLKIHAINKKYSNKEVNYQQPLIGFSANLQIPSKVTDYRIFSKNLLLISVLIKGKSTRKSEN